MGKIVRAAVLTAVVGYISVSGNVDVLAQQRYTGSYTINKHIGDVYVASVEITSAMGEYMPDCPTGACVQMMQKGWLTYITPNVSLPKCGRRYYLDGYVKVKYRNGQSWMEATWDLDSGKEGYQGKLDAKRFIGWYNDPASGNVEVSTSATCKLNNNPRNLLPRW
ncbi:hypothetical protein QUB63_07705 [Microcoleus sp. ARI1-B5]|uniref:hypothetical protein n=1 Tax=unclassified Microcoleus TaxID=2642155 RepID=UPI002FD35885